MKTENKHTPTPWFANNCTIQHMELHFDIAKCYGESIEMSIEEEQANCRHIVHCVNSHESLKAEIEQLRKENNELVKGNGILKYSLEQSVFKLVDALSVKDESKYHELRDSIWNVLQETLEPTLVETFTCIDTKAVESGLMCGYKIEGGKCHICGN